jgi:hypothetical protein
LGFLSTTTFKNGWQAGLRLTVKWMYEGKCYITNYPSLDDFTQIIDNKMLFTLDLPISYKLFGPCSRYKLTLMPFFQIRHYGGRFNYPIDFYDTRYDTYGARLLLDIQF